MTSIWSFLGISFLFFAHPFHRSFLHLAAEVGLWVILRPGPYIGSDLDLGGLPRWISAIELNINSSYVAQFLSHISCKFQRKCDYKLWGSKQRQHLIKPKWSATLCGNASHEGDTKKKTCYKELQLNIWCVFKLGNTIMVVHFRHSTSFWNYISAAVIKLVCLTHLLTDAPPTDILLSSLYKCMSTYYTNLNLPVY